MTVSPLVHDTDEGVVHALEFTGEVEPENVLARAGLPVIERLARDLGDLAISIELTDSHANVIGRVVGANVLASALDRNRATVAAPITDPRRDVQVGAVGVACALPDAGALMLPYAQLAARTIGDRMMDRAAVAERVLLEQFFRARRRARGPLLAVNGSELLTNAAAAGLVRPEDRARIWNWATNAIETNEFATRELHVSTSTFAARCEPVRVGGDVVGALVHLDELTRQPKTTGRAGRVRSTGRPKLGWASLRSSELGIADLVADGLTNREIAARIFVSPHTVDFHLRQIYRKLSITSRIELTRMFLEHATKSPRAVVLVQ